MLLLNGMIQMINAIIYLFHKLKLIILKFYTLLSKSSRYLTGYIYNL